MKIKISVIFIFLSFILVLNSFAATTALDGVKKLSDGEANGRLLNGSVKIIGGGLLTAGGIAAFNGVENIWGKLALLPFASVVSATGLVTAVWGVGDLVFGPREYEDSYSRINRLPDDQKETGAFEYLKTKAEKDKKDRQPSFWNLFGVLSMFETPAEKEYNQYMDGLKTKERGII
ncbi:MAG: hypothetical protein WCV91_01585 [Candidatus Margulisiibacteriota bacterium]